MGYGVVGRDMFGWTGMDMDTGNGLMVGKHGVGLVVGWCTHCRWSLLSL